MGKESKDGVIFDATRLRRQKDEFKARGLKTKGTMGGFYVDGSDAYANNGMMLGFHHIPSGENVYFKAFITSFNESYSSDWSSEQLYGRADPIQMFKSTTRTIALAFNVPAASMSEAYENLANVGKLSQFLYPYYTEIKNATTIAQSPLVRMKVMNMLASQKNDETGKNFKSFIASAGKFNASNGLLGAITSLSIAHNLDSPDHGVLEVSQGTILPKMIEVTIDFTAIHEHSMGWTMGTDASGSATGKVVFRHNSWPYGLDLDGSGPADKTTIKSRMSRNATISTNLQKATDEATQAQIDEREEQRRQAEESAAAQAAEESAAADQAAAFGFGSTDLPAEESEYREDTAVDADGNPI